ncbi:MAG: gliding motility lipoprotein GldD [Bacteroidales bacterium]|nr:gliding motility lipoprotein GldD [Bacteroidales bacterium]
MDSDIYHSITTGLEAISVQSVALSTIIQSILLIVLLFFSALISGSEVAYFSLTPKECQDMENSNSLQSKLALKLLQDPKRLLATILIGNNFVNVAIIMLSAFVSSAIIDFGDSTVLKFIFETIIITSLILFFGEVMPKIFAKQHRKRFVQIMAYPLQVMSALFKPFSLLLMKSTSIVNDRLSKHQNSNISIDDLQEALQITSNGIREEKDMLESIVKFSNLTAIDIMTPRMDVVALDISEPFDEVLKTVVDSGYSRIPVYDERPDEIKGILYVKDLLTHIDQKNNKEFDWKSLLRKANYVPENKKTNDLLAEFQSSKNHMAIVVDEYGGMQGIVTLEDILEEIVGEISDELDTDEAKLWQKLSDGSIIFEGKISLNDFFKVTNIEETEFDEKRGDAETLAGFLLEINGLIPQKKDIIRYKDHIFEIVSADIRRIKKVKYHSIKVFIALILGSMFMVGCGDNYVPKPHGYFRIDLPEHSYSTFDSLALPYTFEKSDYAVVSPDKKSTEDEHWINISYPQWNCKIHVTYRDIRGMVEQALEDNRKLAYKHTVKADAIGEEYYDDAEHGLYGALYLIKGNAATPMQFAITDSAANLFRGSVYFWGRPNQDSLAPVVDYLEKDVTKLIESLRFRKQVKK